MEKEQQATGMARLTLTEQMLAELRAANITSYKQAISHRRSIYDIPRDAFMEQLRITGSAVMASMGEVKKFEYDPETTRIAEQLYLYTTGSEKFDGDLRKGIALVGNIGCGKTVIMTAYINFLNSLTRAATYGRACVWEDFPRERYYKLETAPSLYRKYNPEIFEDLTDGSMFIDEFGREPKTTKIYGAEAFPVGEILFERHRRGQITHIVSNFTLADLSGPDMYGAILGDRFKQMFNFIVMKGKSRRV